MCFMCAHESSYVYSHVCSKAPCFDDNLVLELHIIDFGTLLQQSPSKSRQDMLRVIFELKVSERKRTCLVGDLCKVIGIFSTTYKVDFISKTPPPGARVCRAVYSEPPTDGGGFRDFDHKVDEFYFTTSEKMFFNFGKLQMYCSEFHE